MFQNEETSSFIFGDTNYTVGFEAQTQTQQNVKQSQKETYEKKQNENIEGSMSKSEIKIDKSENARDKNESGLETHNAVSLAEEEE